MKKIIFTFLYFPALLSAQENLKPAKIILHNNDTLSGYINYSFSRKNPVTFNFLNAPSATAKEISIKDAKLVIIDGTEIFKGAVVKKYINSIDLNDLPTGYSEESVVDTVFLRQLATGNRFSLYLLNDGKKIHFFIEKPQETPEALRYLLYNDGQNLLVERKIYIQQLMAFANGNKAIIRDLQKLTYNYEGMVRMAQLLNESNSLSQYASDAVLSHKYTRWFISAGAGTSKLSSAAGVPNFMTRIPFRASASPLIQGGYEIIFRGNQQRIFVQMFLNAGLLSYKGERTYIESGKTYRDEYQVNALTSQTGMGLNYKIVKKPVEVSIGAGAAINFTSWNKNKGSVFNITDNNQLATGNFSYKNVYPNLFLNTEIHLSSNSSIGLTFRPNHKLTNYAYFSMSQRFLIVAYTYRFIRNKK
jgi:hypothetical protein